MLTPCFCSNLADLIKELTSQSYDMSGAKELDVTYLQINWQFTHTEDQNVLYYYFGVKNLLILKGIFVFITGKSYKISLLRSMVPPPCILQ